MNVCRKVYVYVYYTCTAHFSVCLLIKSVYGIKIYQLRRKDVDGIPTSTSYISMTYNDGVIFV